jgi:hypothetical protein
LYLCKKKKINYFIILNHLASNVCDLCNDECKGCFGPSRTECINCKSDRFLTRPENTCNLTCPSKFFGNILNNICEVKLYIKNIKLTQKKYQKVM